MKRILYLLLLSIGWAITSTAQTQPAATPNQTAYPDVLYLRNGSVFQGRLLQYEHGSHLEFELSTGHVMRASVRDVRRVVQGGAGLVDAPKLRRAYAFREQGLYIAWQAGLSLGRDEFSNAAGAWGIQVAAGHQFSRWFGVGGGLGVDAYAPDRNEVVYPLFAEARGYLTANNQAPFYALRAGYGLAFAGEGSGLMSAQGGWYAQPALGIRWGASRGVNVTTEIGLQLQRAAFTRQIGWRSEERQTLTRTYQRLSCRLGVLF